MTKINIFDFDIRLKKADALIGLEEHLGQICDELSRWEQHIEIKSTPRREAIVNEAWRDWYFMDVVPDVPVRTGAGGNYVHLKTYMGRKRR